MTPQELAELRRRAMAAATLYGSEAYQQESDQSPRESLGKGEFRIIVVRRSQRGEFKLHRGYVRLPDQDLAEAVARIVRDAAVELPVP